jgi:single-strand DNA-binding protein
MASLNKVQLIGHIGRDPEVKYAQSGMAVCSARLATSSKRKDKSTGNTIEETEWHSLVFYDKLAEIVGEWCKKGKQIYVEGRLKTRKWQDKDGNDRYTTEIVCDQMQMLGGRGDDAGPSASSGARPAAARPVAAAPAPAAAPKQGGFDDMDDDIPF